MTQSQPQVANNQLNVRDPQAEADYYDHGSDRERISHHIPIIEVWVVGGLLMLGAVFARFLLSRFGAW